jgi:alkaline phosphatase D
MPLSRRTFLLAASGLIALGASATRCAAAQGRFASYPFTLGVASGYPRPDGFVLWTRLAPDPLNGGGMPPAAVRVDWEVAFDEAFRNIVARGAERATAGFAHAVHAEIAGLDPGRWYWYRFHAGAATSPIGRTRTAPSAAGGADRMRFAVACCQQYEQGYYAAYRHMAADDLDLVTHLGDYIYESSWGRRFVRRHEAPAPVTLAEYRNRHALYKTDRDLQAAHAACPWILAWDDHEVQNDYARDHSQERVPPELFRQRRHAAYQAYYEHMPLPAAARPHLDEMRIYGRSSFGTLARFFVLDDRQYRSPQACPRPGRGGGNVVEDCPERLYRDRTLLGGAQERWLFGGLSATPARWNVIAQQTLMAQMDRLPGEGEAFWTDGWDGYPAARQRLLGYLRERRVANPIVLGGDVHMSVVADLKTDFGDETAPVVATEFVTTSITSEGAARNRVDAWRADNPHIRHADPTRRGYTVIELSGRRCIAHLRTLDDASDPHSRLRTFASFAVEDGRPGAERY